MIKNLLIFLSLAYFYCQPAFAGCYSGRVPKNPQFLLDGGSVKVDLQSACGKKKKIEFKSGLSGGVEFLVNGRTLKAGSPLEQRVLMELDDIILHRWPNKSIKEIKELEMQTKDEGLGFLAVISIIEGACMRELTVANNKTVCAKYSPN